MTNQNKIKESLITEELKTVEEWELERKLDDMFFAISGWDKDIYYIQTNWDGNKFKSAELNQLKLSEIKKRVRVLVKKVLKDRKSTRLNSSHIPLSRMPSSA